MQDHLMTSVLEKIKEREQINNPMKWRELDRARILEMMIEYYYDNYCIDDEAPVFITEEYTGLGLDGIGCSTAWELLC